MNPVFLLMLAIVIQQARFESHHPLPCIFSRYSTTPNSSMPAVAPLDTRVHHFVLLLLLLLNTMLAHYSITQVLMKFEFISNNSNTFTDNVRCPNGSPGTSN